MILHFILPVRTSNPLNGHSFGFSNKAMHARAAQRRRERAWSQASMHAALAKAGLRAEAMLPCVVTCTRASSGKGLDSHDALPASMKSIVDGIADALGINDGGPSVEWRFRQKTAPRGVAGVLVTIERRT